jgi:DNA-binding winged helix-turn-helix (wHTH) protein
MEQADGILYRFAEFVLDRDGGELTRNGERVPLMPTLFRLLVHFLENRNKLLAKGELLDAVWAGAHVTEASLARAVAMLRDALGDDARRARYIETFSRRGYKFIAVTMEEGRYPESPFRLICEGLVYPLQLGHNVIGRGAQSVVPIDSTGVSRRHALVVVTPSGATLVDLQSTNGTFVRGERISGSVPLADGDQISVGPVLLTLTTRQQIAAKTTDVIR